MKDDQFVNLHLHTHYSVQDSTIRIPELFYYLEEQGQKAVAITDHGSIEGWNDFYLVGQDTEIKPIFGCEFYCKPTLEQPKNTIRYHLVVLAKNNEGIKCINKLQYESVKHKYYKPLLPYPILFEEAHDVFISTACSLGTLGQCYDKENIILTPNDAEPFLNKLLDIFGKDNVALEFQFHPDYPFQGTFNSELLKLWDNVDMKYCIATTDAHFITKSESRRKLQADGWGKKYSDVKPTLYSNCVGTSELIKRFAKESEFSAMEMVDEMINNTSIIANKCNVDNINNINGPRVLPKFNKHRQFKKIFMKQPRKVI
ncbi:MAG: PHP domain-containing protein [Bacilli bacterium]|nr:PHP domain-containing protein [Bacilli bacterium]